MTAFVESSKKITEKFLQSVVVVDDLANRTKLPNNLDDEVGSLENQDDPNIGAKDEINDDSKEQISQEDDLDQIEESDIDSYPLFSKKIIRGFVNKGIGCTIIEPEKEEVNTLAEKIFETCLKSDVIILDWYLHGNGDFVPQLLERLFKEDDESANQLKYIMIYTTPNNQTDVVIEKFYKFLESQGEVYIDKDNLFVARKGINIKIYLKILNEQEDKKYKRHQISEDAIPDKVVEDFSKITRGLVSNTLLNSLAIIRKNTYKLLNRFSVDLDAPFLTHRLLIPTPQDSGKFLLALISDELSSLLEEYNSFSEMKFFSISDWVDYREDEGLKFDLNFNEMKFNTKDKIKNLLENGLISEINNCESLSNSKKKEHLKGISGVNSTEAFNCSNENQSNPDFLFAELTTMRTFYGKLNPILSQGTILKKCSDDGDYLVSLQPRCDTVRINGVRKFLFLRLKLVQNKPFDIVLYDKNTPIFLKAKKSIENLQLINFSSNSEMGMIVAKIEENSDFVFIDVDNQKYRWIGELKPFHALRISQALNSQLSRIGLDESEWLRLSAKERDN